MTRRLPVESLGMSSRAGTALAFLTIVATVVSGDDVVLTREQLVAAHQRTGETTLQSLPVAPFSASVG